MKMELRATTIRVKHIKRQDIDRMYELFSEYYDNHTPQAFEHDLFEKDHVILLRDKKNSSLQGFSTLLRVPLKKSGKKVVGVFSGDTVINKQYWGSAALGREFLKYLWKLKLRKPATPVYWFLISKGYKTYLLMARNFAIHYPRYDQQTPPEYKQLINDFYQKKFGEYYNRETDIISFPGKKCALKDHVADITTDLLKDERIAFFQKKNPEWIRGDELACIARMTFWMPFKYALKKTLKARFR